MLRALISLLACIFLYLPIPLPSAHAAESSETQAPLLFGDIRYGTSWDAVLATEPGSEKLGMRTIFAPRHERFFAGFYFSTAYNFVAQRVVSVSLTSEGISLPPHNEALKTIHKEIVKKGYFPIVASEERAFSQKEVIASDALSIQKNIDKILDENNIIQYIVYINSDISSFIKIHKGLGDTTSYKNYENRLCIQVFNDNNMKILINFGLIDDLGKGRWDEEAYLPIKDDDLINFNSIAKKINSPMFINTSLGKATSREISYIFLNMEASSHPPGVCFIRSHKGISSPYCIGIRSNKIDDILGMLSVFSAMFTIPIPEAVFERCSDELNSINVSAQKVQERFFRNGQVEYRFSLTEDGSYVLRLYAIK